MEKELEGLEERPKAKIHIDSLRATLPKIPNWKTPGHDSIRGYRFKKFTSIYERVAIERNSCLQEADVPEWMTKGKTIFIQKYLLKGTVPNNYRPITCQPIMGKILMAQTRWEIYNLLNKP